MAYTEDKQPSGLSVLTDLANDDTVIVGDTSDVNEVVKTISWTNLKTAISTYVEGLASYFNVTTGTTDDITEGETNKFASTANVDAAGAVMNTDTTTAAMSFVIDEDTMVSDLATKVPTQQSVKAYVDANAGSVSELVSSIQFVIDGGGSAITTGVKGYLEVPFACTINQVTLLADQSGSIVVDINKSTYSGFPTTSSICASALPTLSTAQKSQDATLTSWTTSISAGDVLEFEVDSVTTVTRVTLSLKVTRT